jgi:hypothetical protein
MSRGPLLHKVAADGREEGLNKVGAKWVAILRIKDGLDSNLCPKTG